MAQRLQSLRQYVPANGARRLWVEVSFQSQLQTGSDRPFDEVVYDIEVLSCHTHAIHSHENLSLSHPSFVCRHSLHHTLDDDGWRMRCHGARQTSKGPQSWREVAQQGGLAQASRQRDMEAGRAQEPSGAIAEFTYHHPCMRLPCRPLLSWNELHLPAGRQTMNVSPPRETETVHLNMTFEGCVMSLPRGTR